MSAYVSKLKDAIALVGAMYFLSFGAYASITELNLPAPRSEFDISHDYHQTLLLKALELGAEGRALPAISHTKPMSHGRAVSELINNKIDVYWFGTNQELEKDLAAIRVPTTRGLIGYRKFIIRKDNRYLFDKVNTLSDLKKLIACQGAHWPDTNILEGAGLSVTTTPNYENLFKMVNQKRCDYFPRGLHDTKTELDLRKSLYPELTVYEPILLAYPFAVYFFVNKQSVELRTWLSTGLEKLAQQGEIDKLMQQHPLTSMVYPLSKITQRVIFEIPNPALPVDTRITDPNYWIRIEAFNNK